jgi:hypothetical protein
MAGAALLAPRPSLTDAAPRRLRNPAGEAPRHDPGGLRRPPGDPLGQHPPRGHLHPEAKTIRAANGKVFGKGHPLSAQDSAPQTNPHA